MTMEIENIFFHKLTKRSDKWYPYFNVYEKHLSKFINKNPKVLEIGVLGGGSLEMWHHYFGDGATIYGVDNDQEVLKHKYNFDVDLTIGDQEDIEFWNKYTQKNGFFDIIIDDGGHTMKQQENTLISLFKNLNYGGVFIIEDTHTSYWKNYGGGLRKPDSFIELSKSLVDLLHMRHIEEQPGIKLVNSFHGLESVSFYDSIVVLEKEIPKDFRRVLSDNREDKL